MKDVAEQLLEKVRQKDARLGVIGLGYVGLPLAVEFARSGLQVTGLDLDAERVKTLNAGGCYIPDVSAGDVHAFVTAGKLRADTSIEVLKDQDVVIICVPTPLRKTKDPDLSYIVAAVEGIGRHLHSGQLIILESTTYPGTTEEVVLPILEKSGLTVGKDFFLGFSPERVDPGNKQYTIRNTPKVVAGLTPACSSLAQTVYRLIAETVVPVSSTKVAETVKLLENTFRSVNIGLVNEIALMCRKLDIDVWEVIDAAATKPFGFLPFYPGPGIGGHCIPIDPFYLSWKARQNRFEPRFIELAGQINGRMPDHVVEKITEALNLRGKCLRGARMLIVGVAYKQNINDVRESPALDIIMLLRQWGVEIAYHDPHVPVLHVEGADMDLTSVDLTEAELEKQDCVVIVTPHSSLDYQKLIKFSPLIMDTRNALKGSKAPHIIRL